MSYSQWYNEFDILVQNIALFRRDGYSKDISSLLFCVLSHISRGRVTSSDIFITRMSCTEGDIYQINSGIKNMFSINYELKNV